MWSFHKLKFSSYRNLNLQTLNLTTSYIGFKICKKKREATNQIFFQNLNYMYLGPYKKAPTLFFTIDIDKITKILFNVGSKVWGI